MMLDNVHWSQDASNCDALQDISGNNSMRKKKHWNVNSDVRLTGGVKCPVYTYNNLIMVCKY